MPSPQETINQARDAYLQSQAQLRAALNNIPEDRLNWSPSASARTPIQLAAHSAQSVQFIREQMSGTPFRYKTTAEADAFFREWEQQFESREQVLALLDEASYQYLAFLDELTPEHLEMSRVLPFGLGVMPVMGWLTAAPMHTRHHAAQIEYIQTIYEDRDWHV